MNTEEAGAVIDRIIGRIAPEVDLTSVARDADLGQELDLDSMDFLNVVTGVFEATGIDIPERDYPEMQSLDGFVRYLVQHSGG